MSLRRVKILNILVRFNQFKMFFSTTRSGHEDIPGFQFPRGGDPLTLNQNETPYGVYRKAKFDQLAKAPSLHHNDPFLCGLGSNYKLGPKASVLDLVQTAHRSEKVFSFANPKSGLPVQLTLVNVDRVRLVKILNLIKIFEKLFLEKENFSNPI